MRITILFGGTNKERLVSVASAQALHQALPEADLWFWHAADTVHDVPSKKLLNHARPFEDEFKPDDRGVRLEQALDRAKAEDRLLVLGLHGGRGSDLRRAGATRRQGFFTAPDRDRSGRRRVRLHGQISAQIDQGDLP